MKYAVSLCVLALCVACTRQLPLALTPTEQEAYLVLVDQLNQFEKNEGRSAKLLCTYVSIDEQAVPLTPAFLDALQHAVPKGMKAEIIDGATCRQGQSNDTFTKDNRRALKFFADRSHDPRYAQDTWEAGWIWEVLWGGGEIYMIEQEQDQPVAKVVGWWAT